MKKILIALSFVAFVGCGKDASLIKVDSNKFNKLIRQNLEVDYTAINEEIKSGTVLVYPQVGDVGNYTYTFDPEIYETVIGSVKGAKERVPSTIAKSMMAEDKVVTIVKVIQLVGIARDNAQVKISDNDKLIASIQEQISPLLDAYTCYKIKSGANENKCSKVRIKDGEDKTERRAEMFRVCNDLSKVVDSYIDMTEEEALQLSQDASKCQSIEKNRIESLRLDNEHQKTIRDYGKALFLNMMGSLEESNGKLYRFVFSGSEDSYDDVSKITFSEDGTKVENLSLFIDFNLGKSFQTYSLEEGNLKILQYVDDALTNTKLLEIEIDTGKFLVRSKLYMSDSNVFGVRLVGEADFIYPDNKVWQGVIRMDLEQNSK
ncbi:putative lipoprotein [Bacteriovorax sp. BSW11_IV]|uniref:hypothetical protein n=1 Tax=Bacteriovorax sp. BSW11_IV TaxID=1353529 RepID=UPI000389E461|nr:hypothetical protein [Bacteriovorax sp. BSW11_IV]EQC49888.1 putative lipoprotein [Bacteriovorax sp. BSW11_IV]